MALCVNQSGTWREITTNCVNVSGTWRNIQTGCINQSGTWRCYGFYSVGNCPLGSSVEGGFLVKKSGGVAWIIAPGNTEVSRTWFSRNDANTRAQQVSGCTGWFVPTISQLQNPGYTCRAYWDERICTYWSSTQSTSTLAFKLTFRSFPFAPAGSVFHDGKNGLSCVRAFRCVTY